MSERVTADPSVARAAPPSHGAQGHGLAETLHGRVRPLALARERVLPVHSALVPLLPDGGLRRGAVLSCEGSASGAFVAALVAGPSQAGAWVGVSGVPWFGLAAAAEAGVALERVIAVQATGEAAPVALAALIDGVEVVVASGEGLRPGDARRLAARAGARGAVLVLVDRGGFTPDLVCRTTTVQWEGLEAGAGRLTARQVMVEVTGRRAGAGRSACMWLPGPQGLPVAVDATPPSPVVAPTPIARAG